MAAKIWNGVGEKTPTPDGPPVTAAAPLDELVTAVGGAVVSVDNSLVVVDDEGALVDVVVPDVPVVETASCAHNICEPAAAKISANKTTDNRVISGVARFEPRLEQASRNRFVTATRSLGESARVIVSFPEVVPLSRRVELIAIG